MEPRNPSGPAIRARVLVTSAAGVVQLWDQDAHAWTRDEALAYITVAELVDLPERAAVEAGAGVHAESFFARLQRHAADAQVSPLAL